MKETMWCCIGTHTNGNLWYRWDTLSYTRKDCINNLIGESTMTWKQIRRKGIWQCMKVSVTINPI